MTLIKKDIGNEWLDGGYEVLMRWIVDDLRAKKDLETIHSFYIEYKIGENQIQLTEEQFYHAYKSAELVLKDREEWQKNKPKSKFQRVIQ
jgi:hypothetical protein